LRPAPESPQNAATLYARMRMANVASTSTSLSMHGLVCYQAMMLSWLDNIMASYAWVYHIIMA
jgi:hypothetical protein